MGKLQDRLLQMSKAPGMFLGRETINAVANFINGYEVAATDARLPCDDLHGFDEWVNLRVLLPPGATRWEGRIFVAAATTHQHTYPHARDVDCRACWLFFEWLQEFIAERDSRGVDAIIAEHDAFDWPEVIEDDEEAEDSNA